MEQIIYNNDSRGKMVIFIKKLEILVQLSSPVTMYYQGSISIGETTLLFMLVQL